MKSLLSPSSLVVLALIAAAAIVLALTGGDSGSAEPDERAGARSPASGGADEGAVDDVADIIDASDCDPVPLRSDCDIDPDECNLIHNITACDGYEVTVLFNESVTQDDIDEAGALLRAYDDDVEFIIQESFPPTGRAVLKTDDADFCRTVTSDLASKSYVESGECAPLLPGDISGIDPNAPVEQRNPEE